MGLFNKTLIGSAWSIINSLGGYSVKFFFNIVIARLLTPDDYGLIGISLIIIGIANLFTESGFGMALIQKKNVNQEEYSSVFLTNIVIASFCVIILISCAPLISTFYGNSELTKLIRILSLIVILNSICSVPLAILTRSLDFRSQSFINIASSFASGITGFILAKNGFSYWALVFQAFAGQVISTIGIWLRVPWIPVLKFSFSATKELYKFGYKIFLQGFYDIIIGNIYYAIIGKFITIKEVGFYNRATQFSNLFVKQTTNSFNKVLFSVFSKLQDDKIKLGQAYQITSISLIVLGFPLLGGLIFTSESLILVLLTSKWVEITPLFRVLLVEGFFFPFYIINLGLLYSLNKGGISLKIDVIKKTISVLCAGLIFWIGLKYALCFYVFTTFLGFLVSTRIICNILDIKFKVIILEYLGSIAILTIFLISISFLFKGHLGIFSMGLVFIILYLMLFFSIKLLGFSSYRLFKLKLLLLVPDKLHFLF